MAILLDSGILYAFYDRRDAWHRAALELIQREEGGLVVPTPVIPEVDHLLGERLGIEAQILFYQALLERRYILAGLPPEGYLRVYELNRKYRNLELGFVDAAVLRWLKSWGWAASPPRTAETSGSSGLTF